MLSLAAAALSSALSLAVSWFAWQRISRFRMISSRYAILMFTGGLVMGVLAVSCEKVVLDFTALSFSFDKGGSLSALMVTFLFAAPLEEAAKLIVVWPLYSRREVTSPRTGLLYGCLVGAGFAVSEAWMLIGWAPDWIWSLRVFCAAPAHWFFAGAWGYALGRRGRGAGRFVPYVWLACTLLHGFYDHVAFGRGPALLTALVPMLAFMVIVAWLVLRDVAKDSGSRASSSLLETPSLRAVQRAMRRSDRPLMLHWIAMGTLVTLGVILAALAGAVYFGHRVGIDFALADESNVRSGAPLVLLGSAVLLAFPIAGYLIARASSARSVLEPAMASGIAIVCVVAMLSWTAPVGVVFALAVAPMAFGLACAGAWFGIR